jgi:shikimate kinase
VGAVLAERLGVRFIDLDRCFAERHGDISAYLRQFGYEAYARANVDTYRALPHRADVMALSSGFMTYPLAIHPEYARLRRDIEESATTFVLLSSLDCERCVTETVRRQRTRPFARTAVEEEAVIRERFPTYVALAAAKVETMRPLDAVVRGMLSALNVITSASCG